jgi:transglutaminase-like putative cysteine protease
MMNVHPERAADIEVAEGGRDQPRRADARLHRSSWQQLPAHGRAGRRVLDHARCDRRRSRPAGPIEPEAGEVRPEHLPDECLRYLAGSRYCETDRLWGLAWKLFGATEPGWARVQAICDYVHHRLAFSYGYARATRTAIEAHEERVGVCRDFAHLAIAFCRCMNIPARYVNGYLGDIGVEPDPSPMDFSAWFEAYLGGRWYAFDARHNTPRIGRIVVARGRDAMDVPLLHSFGPHQLKGFRVWADEVPATALAAPARPKARPDFGSVRPGARRSISDRATASCG